MRVENTQTIFFFYFYRKKKNFSLPTNDESREVRKNVNKVAPNIFIYNADVERFELRNGKKCYSYQNKIDLADIL